MRRAAGGNSRSPHEFLEAWREIFSNKSENDLQQSALTSFLTNFYSQGAKKIPSSFVNTLCWNIWRTSSTSWATTVRHIIYSNYVRYLFTNRHFLAIYRRQHIDIAIYSKVFRDIFLWLLSSHGKHTMKRTFFLFLAYKYVWETKKG